MLSDGLKDVYIEIFNTGIGRASDSLSRLLNTFVELEKPKILFLDCIALNDYLPSINAEKYIAVSQDIEGAVNGKGIISFPLTEGKTLIDVLLENQSSSDRNFTDIEIEAITEVGNMVINSVASAIADMSSLVLAFQIPKVFFSETLIPMELRKKDDLFCVAETQFAINDYNICGYINLVFSLQHAEIIANKVLEGI